jgi:hypothetical protein
MSRVLAEGVAWCAAVWAGRPSTMIRAVASLVMVACAAGFELKDLYGGGIMKGSVSGHAMSDDEHVYLGRSKPVVYHDQFTPVVHVALSSPSRLCLHTNGRMCAVPRLSDIPASFGFAQGIPDNPLLLSCAVSQATYDGQSPSITGHCSLGPPTLQGLPKGISGVAATTGVSTQLYGFDPCGICIQV